MAARARVLVIDDDPDFLEFARIVLEAGDYEVLTAESAAAGLTLMREAQPDLVLLDVVISYAFSGLDVTRNMREDPQLKAIPLILISAIVSGEEPELFPAHECPRHDLFMSKPIEPAELLRRANELTSSRGERAECTQGKRVACDPPEEVHGISATSPTEKQARRSMLLTALYVAQEQHGYLSQEALRRTAERLNISLKDAYSTASFYSLFQTQSTGRYVVQVCQGLSCRLAGGAERLVEYIRGKLGIEVGQTTPDELFTLETVQCLASCGSSPTLRINDELYEDMTPEKVDRLLDQLAGR